MNAKHTPTPWYTKQGAEIFSSTGARICVVSVRGESYEQDEATTEFIVRAVNSHDALVKALRECEDYFDQRADADCVGDPAAYVGNREMTLLGVVLRALEAGQP